MKKIIEEKPDFSAKESKSKSKAKNPTSPKGSAGARESVKKRKKAKKQDKMARWSGIILFTILLLVGFLMWVAGEVSIEPVVKLPTQSRVVPSVTPSMPGSGRVVVE